MPDADPPARGTGRSKTERAKSPRRNVTVPLDESLYELMCKHAEVAGLSISRFGEQAIKDSIYVTAQEEAVQKAIEKYDNETVEHLNGKLGFCFAKFSSDAFIESVAKVARDGNQTSGMTEADAVAALADPEFRKRVEDDYLSRREEIFSGTWQFVDGMAVLWKIGGLLQSMKPADRDSFLSGVMQALEGRVDRKEFQEVHKSNDPIKGLRK